MLHASALHFARLDSLGDSHEGAPPKLVLQQVFGSIDWQRVADGGHDPDFIRQEVEASWFTQTREMGYVNCWHMNEDVTCPHFVVHGL